MSRLSPIALGVALGTVWGGALFITTWFSYFTGYGSLFLEVLARSVYPGYTITPAGSFLGLFYGFLDGFISAALIGWIYNKIISYGSQ
jgi:hypothetical protein